MLHHTFDQYPDDEYSFTWSEVYQIDEAFKNHLANPDVGVYLTKHAELGDNFTVEEYKTTIKSIQY